MMRKRSCLAAAFLTWLAIVVPVVAQHAAVFVGAEACAGCHPAEAERWRTSHHAKAMQGATPTNVLGDFSNATLTHHGRTTTFYRDGEKFMVQTEGPDGGLDDYQVSYTFGVYPLQQYLIALPGGRTQAFGIGWDSRSKEIGGQRWFHLYPDQDLKSGDRLHWSGRDQTWNYQCASCHSTNLQKNYDLAADSYAMRWSDLNVACEACHGPGSQHVQWAKDRRPESTSMGLTTELAPADPGHWRMNPETGIAARDEPPRGQELEVCAPCHSRRNVIADNPSVGTAFLDSYLPALLEPGLYHTDGQIDGEVFEYGSFVQSRMHHAGVRCSDCHEPHSLTLRAQGNELCAQCHLPAKFDTTAHHRHTVGSLGARCVNCHMPAKTYMIVDERRDHSFRVPRPDLSVLIGTPNVCAQCHADRSAEWAAATVSQWFPSGRQTERHYGTALDAARTGAVEAERLLDELLRDGSAPEIARATALKLLPDFATRSSEPALKAAFADSSPLVRAAAPQVLRRPTSPTVVEAAVRLLSDPVRSVRIEAARALAGIDQRMLTSTQQTTFASAYLELVASEMIDADRPEVHLNLGLLEMRLGRLNEAQQQYETALRLDPAFVPALANLADLERQRGREDEGETYLRKALTLEPDNADVRHSLGLLLVRRINYTEAMPELRKAHELAPDNARYAYVYAIALNSMGSRSEALELLENVRRPADRDVLVALVSLARESGDLARALAYAKQLAALDPADVQLRMLLLDLEKRQVR